MSEDPISKQDAEVIAAVVDHIDPDTPLTDQQLHRAVGADLDPPPTLREVRTVLAILKMPHLDYQPGEPSGAVLDRMRAMLQRAENPPAVDLQSFLGNLPY